MPNKPKNKDKNRRKRPRSSDSRENVNQTNLAPKKKKGASDNKVGGCIAKSRQLTEKLHRTRSSSGQKRNRTSEARICGNGKPMPSLSELERMFEDSDDNGEETSPTTRCATPEQAEQPLQIADDKLMSPNTIKNIATKIMDMLEKHPTIEIDNDGPPPPVIPQRKRKKPDAPYIDGCKDRPQVEWRPKTSFCQGGKNYGVDNNPDPDEDDSTCPKKRKKNVAKVNISKSIFNAKSDEIAARLKQSDGVNSGGSDSSDSNKTVDYDFNSNFSPLPSTSRDNDTILKNDQLFNKSLTVTSDIGNSLPKTILKNDEVFNESLTVASDIGNSSPVTTIKNESLTVPSVIANSSQDEVEIIECPCEIIEVDDSLTDRHPSITRPVTDYTDDDDCCIVVPSEDTVTTSLTKTDSHKDEFYGSLNLYQNYDNDVCEIIDVDDVIAENQAIIKKYRSNNNIDTVTLVEPSTLYPAVQPQDSSQSNNTNLHTVTGSTHLPSKDVIAENQTTAKKYHTNNNIDTANLVEPSTSYPAAQPQGRSQRNNYNLRKKNGMNTNVNSNQTTAKKYHTNNNIDTANLVEPSTSYPAAQPQGRSQRNNYNLRKKNGMNTNVNSGCRDIVRHHELDNLINDFLDSPSGCNCEIPDSIFLTNNARDMANILDQHRMERSRNINHETNANPFNFLITNVTRHRVPANNNSKSKNSESPDMTLSHSTTPQNEPEYNKVSQIGRDCPICLESLSNKLAASTMCGHIFCMDCIKAAIRSSGKRCPTCRKGLKGVGYHPLFL